MSRLPVPDSIKSFKGINIDDHVDSTSRDGRIRTVPHERGQWFAHIYSKIECPELNDLVQEISDYNLEGVNIINDLHITFIRGHYTLRHHQIDSFCLELKKQLEIIPPFSICLSKLMLFQNNEQTRCFLSIVPNECDINSKINILSNDLSEKLYTIFNEFGCSVSKTPNEQTIFHSSLAWSSPNFKSNLEKLVQISLEEPIMVYIDTIESKIGNLIKTFDLNKNL